ncbi:MAG: DUF535 family protein [Burkholderiaceae bacterium]
MVRSTRVLALVDAHQRFLALDVSRNYLAAEWNTNLFHHLSQRAYLIEGLSIQERITYLHDHYAFENQTFGVAYKRKIYLEDGFTLWEAWQGGSHIAITLSLSPRCAPEGELSVCLMVNGTRLHCLSFNWIAGGTVGMGSQMLPFIGRNQGASAQAQQALASFNGCFPNNSPSFFCFSALQGLAQALGMTSVLGIKGEANICFERCAASSFINAYDRFWTSLEGKEIAEHAYLISLPFYQKPLSEVATKHRKRAAMRRAHWEGISASARKALHPYLFANESARLAA